LAGNLQERKHLEDLDVDVIIYCKIDQEVRCDCVLDLTGSG